MILYKTSVPHITSHESKYRIFNDGTSLFLQVSLASETYANYTFFHRRELSSIQAAVIDSKKTIKINSSSIWHGGVGNSCRLQHLESPGSIPSGELFFLGGGGYILFYFETSIADSFAYYLFSFYLFFDEIHV